MSDPTRNLNPTPEAVIAMCAWGTRYAAQNGGSMDFWDGLSAADQRLCAQIVESVRKADQYHQSRTPPVASAPTR